MRELGPEIYDIVDREPDGTIDMDKEKNRVGREITDPHQLEMQIRAELKPVLDKVKVNYSESDIEEAADRAAAYLGIVYWDSKPEKTHETIRYILNGINVDLKDKEQRDFISLLLRKLHKRGKSKPELSEAA